MAKKKKKKDDLFTEKDAPLFPVGEVPYQGERGKEHLTDFRFDLDSDQELELGETEKLDRKRTLREEKGAGHEPAVTDEEIDDEDEGVLS